ncbi:MAG TPA: hypothetical protein VGI97_01190 [Gemmatimonadaceae bacterium]|jgi:hypothetical protein
MSSSFTLRTMIRATWPLLIASAAFAQRAPAAATRAAEPAVASYVSQKINDRPLPMTDRVSDDTGVQYLIEFDQLILTILPKHEFRAALRYRQTLASKGARMGRDPLQKMLVYGTWSVVGTELRFVPDPKRGGNGLRILTGTFSGREINVPFDYRNGTVSHHATVLLRRDDNIF